MLFESYAPLAFLLAVPVIVILYLLVPKGQDQKISSNLLWKRLFFNEQSKTFLEKFIHNLLMYVQIALVILLVLALMSPYIRTKGTGGAIVYVLDTSGSMKHETEAGTTRFDEAVKEIAARIAAGDGNVSLVTCDGTGTSLLAVNSADKKGLQQTLKQIRCTDTSGDLSASAGLLQTICGEGKTQASVLVYTDGNGAQQTTELTKQLNASVCVMGDEALNAANSFLSCTKDGDSYTAAAGIVNYSDYEASMEVSLLSGDKVLAMRSVTVAANESTTCLFSDLAWDGTPLHSRISAIRFAGSDRTDSLSADNEAYALLETDAGTDAILLGDGNTYVEKAYFAATGQTLAKTSDPYTVKETSVVVCDADTAALAPDGQNVLVFAKTGDAKKENTTLTAADTDLTDGISGFTVGVNETQVYELPKGAVGFLWCGEDCAAYYENTDNVRKVVIGFDIRESDLALQPEFPVLMKNVFSYLGKSSLLTKTVYEAGETVALLPGETAEEQPASDQVGLYSVRTKDGEESYIVRFPADQSDGRETAEDVGTLSGSDTLVRKQVRNILLVAVLILLLAEWVLYVRQMRYRGHFYRIVRAVGVVLLLLSLCDISVQLRRADDATVFLVDLSKSNEANRQQMEAYLKEQIAAMPKNNQYAVVTFGADALVDQFLTDEPQTASLLSAPDETATDLESAILSGLSLIPEDAAGRLVVLTDGKETKGSIARTAQALTAKDAELLALVYDSKTSGDDVYIEDVSMPDTLYYGDAYSMTVTLESNYETDADLVLLQGTKEVSRTGVHIAKGQNQFVLKQTAQSKEAEQYTVKVEAGDSCAENDSYRVYAAVDAAPRILLVTGMDEDSTAFRELLTAAGCDYSSVTAVNAPDTLDEMLAYRSIVLENVYYDDLPEGFVQNLETYVKDYGCGLVCCGGEDSYALGGYRDTVLETVLPVDMQLRGINESQTQAMVMVIDHSGSMSGEAGSVSNLDLAIAAASEAVDQLDETDEVGVVAFDDTYTWQVPLQKVTDPEAVKQKIQTVNEGGGTTIKPAVYAAYEALKESDAQLKHIILLTDGQGETRDYSDLIADSADADITLSAVAVGGESDTVLLKYLADQCGGRYYYADTSTDLPKIFAQEVFLNGDSYLQNGTFSLSMQTRNAVTNDLFSDGIPQILGYVSTSPKTGANVLLVSDKQDPVLALMQYGLGHTAAWTSDVTNRWSAALAQTDDYVQLWKRIIDYSAGQTSLGEDEVSVTTKNGVTTVRYEAKDPTEATGAEAVYTDPDGATKTVKLTASAAGVFEAELSTETSGIYNIRVRRTENGEVTNTFTTAAIVQYSDEYQFAKTNETFLAFVKQYGKTITEDDFFWERLSYAGRADTDLTNVLLILFLLWFLLDVAIRRFSFVPHWTKRTKNAIITSEQETPSPKKKTREKKQKEAKTKEQETLDTSALLKKKEKRNL